MMPKVKGSHSWAVILCYASDRSAPTWPGLDYFRTLIQTPDGNGLYTWWQQVSGGNLDFVGSNVFGWYSLAKQWTAEQVSGVSRGQQDQLVAAARDAATAAGASVSGYLHTLAIIVGFSGGGNTGTDVAWGFGFSPNPNNQPGWRWCKNCEALAYWDFSREPGFCIVGARHDHSGSSYYSLSHDISFTNGQPGWRWCKNCEALIFLTATPAPCPGAGGQPHALGSGAHYVLRNNSTGDGEQQNWRWCNKCQALAYWDASRQPGPCPISGRHDHTGSGNYSIPFAWQADLGFLAHETGHGFGLDHAFGTDRTGPFYDDQRPGCYGDWTDIMSWARTASFGEPVYTPAGAGLSAPTLYKLGWLLDSEVATDIGGTIKLKPVHGMTIGSNPRVFRVIDAEQGWIYTAEYRAPMTWDRGIQSPRVVIHAMRTLYQAGQDGWRLCANCEGLIYAGQAACPAGGVHDGSASSDYWLSLNAGPGAGQTNWFWCNKCCGLFFAGNGKPGACPAGGNHDASQSGYYALPSSGAGQVITIDGKKFFGQSNWQWCNKCQGLAFAGNSTPGVCPASGLHDHTGSGDYVLYMTPTPPKGKTNGSVPNLQNKWRWCSKCQSLYYAGLGACQGYDVHEFSGSDDYALVHDLAGAAGQPGWRYCRKCYALAFNDGSRPPGACAAGGSHDHSTSREYVIPRDAETEAGQRQWWWCNKCSALNYIDANRGPGLCSAGGNHDPSGSSEYLVAHDTTAVLGATGFRWCRDCQNMVLGNNAPGCKRGGNHDTSASANYVVRTDPASLVREHPWWRTCTKCNSLFHLNTPDGSSEKPCAAGDSHSPTGEYFVTYVDKPPAKFAFWRWCRKCESMAFWDGSRAPGPCPADGKQHDHSGSGFYIPPCFRLDVTQVVNDNLGAGGSWTNSDNTIRFNVTAVDDYGNTTLTSATVEWIPHLRPIKMK